MTQRTDLELIPDQKVDERQVFESRLEADQFWEEFLEMVRPEMERLAEARRSSEEEAKRRWLR